MLGMPAPTPFDLNFRLFGIPVRVNPWFWLLAVFLCPEKREGHVMPIVVWVACVLVSILVHEFGHGLTAKAFGFRSEIALFGMGGLCASEGERQTFWQRIAVILAGPGAGFLLFGVVLAFYKYGLTALKIAPSETLFTAVSFLLLINLVWSIVNLLPLWPLDGGQLLGVLLSRASPRNGQRWAHIVALVGFGCLAAWLFSKEQTYNGIVCLLLGFTNYQILQAMHQARQYGFESSEDDADWWKR